MNVEPTRDQFEAAARMHLRAASAAANYDGGQPKSAAYLAHVAAECAIKHRILSNHGKTRTRDVKTAIDGLFTEIFAGRSGHDLRALAGHGALRRLLAAENQTALLDGDAWGRMIKPERPYSLRYGTETLGAQQARGEIEVVESIVRLLLRRV